MHVKWHNNACAYTKFRHLGLEREFKEISQNLRKFGSYIVKKEFQFQAVEALDMHGYLVGVTGSTWWKFKKEKKNWPHR